MLDPFQILPPSPDGSLPGVPLALGLGGDGVGGQVLSHGRPPPSCIHLSRHHLRRGQLDSIQNVLVIRKRPKATIELQ